MSDHDQSRHDDPRQTQPSSLHLSRREALKWMAAAAAAMPVVDGSRLGAEEMSSLIGADPNLLDPTVPWDRTLTEGQLRTAAALCDVILPADDRSPAASAVGVHEFIDEWVSAPYQAQKADRGRILTGLDWLEEESHKRFDKGFTDLNESQQRAICDDICHVPDAKEEFREAAWFFTRFRDLTTGAFYTSQEGMDDIQYVGNVVLSEFTGPPPEVLAHLGLD